MPRADCRSGSASACGGAARRRGRPRRRRRQPGGAGAGRRDDLDGQFRHHRRRARLRGPRPRRLPCCGCGGVQDREADVAGPLGFAAVPHAARRQPHRLCDGPEDGSGARSRNPASRPSGRCHDGAGRRRRRGLRPDDAARRREDARDRAPARPACGDRARGGSPGGGSAHRHPARRRHRPDPPLRPLARRRARRGPADRHRFRAPGGRGRRKASCAASWRMRADARELDLRELRPPASRRSASTS